MRLKVEAPWRFVSFLEFEELLKRYPRALTAEPPLERKALFRKFIDPAFGSFPSNVVATWNRSRKAGSFQVRTDIEDWDVKEVHAANTVHR
jgi:hypothetical protein